MALGRSRKSKDREMMKKFCTKDIKVLVYHQIRGPALRAKVTQRLAVADQTAQEWAPCAFTGLVDDACIIS